MNSAENSQNSLNLSQNSQSGVNLNANSQENSQNSAPFCHTERSEVSTAHKESVNSQMDSSPATQAQNDKVGVNSLPNSAQNLQNAATPSLRGDKVAFLGGLANSAKSKRKMKRNALTRVKNPR